MQGQGPLQIPPHNEPLADVLLLKPRADRYRHNLPQPADVPLVVEIAHSSLARDRDVKIPIYGREGIPEAWLVDVQRRVVAVFRHPPARRAMARPSSCPKPLSHPRACRTWRSGAKSCWVSSTPTVRGRSAARAISRQVSLGPCAAIRWLWSTFSWRIPTRHYRTKSLPGWRGDQPRKSPTI